MRGYVFVKIKDKDQSFGDDYIRISDSCYFKVLKKNNSKIIRDSQIQHIKKDNYFFVGDIRLDNRKSIIERYNLKKDIKDSELIIDLYRITRSFKLLLDCVDGAFSFVLIDTKNDKILAARDIFGQRPMYYSRKNSLFLLTSNAEELFKLGINKALNNKKLIKLISLNYKNDSSTIYKNISKIKSGHFLSFSKENFSTKKYFKINSLIKKNKIKDPEKNFYDVFNKSIESLNCLNEKNIGSTLSGGLDSSSISILLSNILKNETLKTFSVHFRGIPKEDFQKTDESYYVKDVLKLIDSDHTFIDLDYENSGPIYQNNKKLKNFVFPSLAINGFMHKEILLACKHKEIEILYDGLFGDEVVSHGMFSITASLKNLNFYRFFRELFYLKKNNVIYSIKNQLSFHIKLLIKNIFRKEVFIIDNKTLESVINKDILKSNHEYLSQKTTTIFNSFLEQELSFYESGLIEFALEELFLLAEKEDVDIRFPFLNKRVVEFCINVDSTKKLHKGRTRYFFRESFKNIFPKSLYNRHTKSNISPFAYNQINENIQPILNSAKKSLYLKDCINHEQLKNLSSKKEYRHLVFIALYKIYMFNLWTEKANID